MNDEVRLLFNELADLEPGERERFLKARVLKPEVRGEVEALLQFDSTTPHSLVTCISGTAGEMLREGEPVSCGAYRIIRLLGSGGMGSVYLARRTDGEVEQTVAVKLLRADSQRRGWNERFLNERQLLASLNHPSIVRMIDAGHTEDGRPYLVMEYVEGKPIDEYISGIGLREVLELFLQVCDGVSHAHSHLIIHRDLKPSNIMVDAAGNPKLLDFGIAKLLDEDSGATQTVERLLTPNYASPEQLLGKVQTTATDIYSLGAVLYKMVTGWSPYESENTTARRLNRSVPADIDFILQKALRNEPEERYASVEALANDLRAFLDSKPVKARSGNAWYLTRKFLRRYWVPVTATSVVIASLAGGLYVADHERIIAERRFALARKLANALVFDIHDKVPNLPGGIELREQISSTGVEYLDALSKEAGRNYALRRELAAGYLRLASAQYAGTQAARRPGSGTGSVETLNRAIALLEGMPASELALASNTEARLRAERCMALFQKSSLLQAAKSDCERALVLTPCSPEHPELCQNRVDALEHLINVSVALREFPTAISSLTAMRRDAEIGRVPGGQRLYQSNVLTAGTEEAKISSVQEKVADAIRILRQLMPVAKEVESRQDLNPAELYRLCRYYDYFIKNLRASGEGAAAERIELGKKGLTFARRGVELDSRDVISQLAIGELLEGLARDYEPTAPAESARLIRESIEPFLQHPDVVAQDIGPRISFFLRGQYGIQVFVRMQKPDDAVAFACRVSSVINPVLFLKMNGARSPEVARVQGISWAAAEAADQRSALAAGLWRQGLDAAEVGLRNSPDDPMMQASAGIAFDGWAANSGDAGAAVYRQRAQSIWRQLNTAYPSNDFIAQRAAGMEVKHTGQ